MKKKKISTIVVAVSLFPVSFPLLFFWCNEPTIEPSSSSKDHQTQSIYSTSRSIVFIIIVIILNLSGNTQTPKRKEFIQPSILYQIKQYK